MSNTGVILVIALIVFALGGLPGWGYHRFGYGPSGLVGGILLVIVILALMGRL